MGRRVLFVCNQCHFKAHLTNTQRTPFALPSAFLLLLLLLIPPSPTGIPTGAWNFRRGTPFPRRRCSAQNRNRGLPAIYRAPSTQHPAPSTQSTVLSAQSTELLGLGFLAAVLCRFAHCLLFTNTNTPTPLAARSFPQRRLYFQIPLARPTGTRAAQQQSPQWIPSPSSPHGVFFAAPAAYTTTDKELTGCQGAWSWYLALHTQDASVSPHG